MRIRLLILLLCALALPGCDKLKVAAGGKPEADPKVLDAEAIGYACRVSRKVPEDCMKENDAQSPSSILDGWKKADADISAKVIDISMGKYNAAAASAVMSGGPLPGNTTTNATPTAQGEQKK